MPHKPIEKEKLEELEFDLSDDYTKLNCPSCDSDIPANDININDKIAKCGQCHAVFSFHKEIEHLSAPNNIEQEITTGQEITAKQEIIRPEGIDIFRFRDSLDFTIQQPLTIVETILFSLSPLSIVPIAFGLIEGIPALPIIGVLLILAGIVYGFTQYYRHKINLTINKRFLTVEWKPRKGIPIKTYPVEDIDQIYVKNTSMGLAVFMLVNGIDGQKHIKLIPKVSSPSKAKYLEQEIEKYLGITDRRVPEENLG